MEHVVLLNTFSISHGVFDHTGDCLEMTVYGFLTTQGTRNRPTLLDEYVPQWNSVHDAEKTLVELGFTQHPIRSHEYYKRD